MAITVNAVVLVSKIPSLNKLTFAVYQTQNKLGLQYTWLKITTGATAAFLTEDNLGWQNTLMTP